MRVRSFTVRAILAVAFLAFAVGQAPGIANADITINYGSGLSTYAFVNVSNATSTVVASYYAPGGNVPALTYTYNNVAPRSRTNVTLGNSDALLPTNWQGSVVLSSDGDLVAVAATRYTGKGTAGNGYGEEMVMYAAFNEGATRLYAPQLLRTSGVNLSTSRMTIQNTTGSAATAYITFYYGGSAVGPKIVALNPYGSVTIDTASDASIAPANWSGTASAVITATQPIAGFAERHWDVVSQQQNWAAGYALLTDNQAGTTLLSPAAFRNCVGGNCVLTFANTFNAYSTYLIQNTVNASTNITITVINRATGLPLANKMFATLAPYASFIWNPFNNNNNPGGALHPQFAEMGGAFNGSARIDANRPIVGVGFTMNPQASTIQNTAGGYTFLSTNDPTNTNVVWAPRFARVCTNCTDYNNIVDFTQFSNLQIINMGTSAVTLDSIEFINGDGTSKFTLNAGNQATYFLAGQSLTLQPGASIAINTRVGGSLDRGGGAGATAPKLDTIFGNNFNGSAKITAPAGAKIKAIVAVSQVEKRSDIYNAINR